VQKGFTCVEEMLDEAFEILGSVVSKLTTIEIAKLDNLS
jgi:hypothetical protein